MEMAETIYRVKLPKRWSRQICDCTCFGKDGYIFNGWDKEFSIVTENIRITALWIESPYADITSAIGFTLENNNAFFISLPNVTETYSFINQISVSPGASWIVSTDIQETIKFDKNHSSRRRR